MSDASTYFLTSKHLGFRPWTHQDLSLALELWGDPEVTRHIVAGGVLSEEEIKARLDQEMDTFARHRIQYWPMFLRREGAFVGCCGLRPYDERKRMLELGVHVCSRHWRRGFASEAARTVMAYAFTTLQVSALFAGHHPRNEASRRLLAKLGFTYTHDAFYAPTGLHHPSYVLTAEGYARWMDA